MKPCKKILCVDDDTASITMFENILGPEYGLASVSSGEEALKVAKIFRPDLILLDVIMPDMDGYETCRRLRADSDLQHVKIILVSAKTDITARLTGYEVGADDYLTRPFEPDELLAKVKVYLRMKAVEELDQVIRDVLRLLNHETRTPLTAISGVIQLLNMEGGLKEANVRELLSGAMINCNRLQALLEKSMLLCEIQSGTITMHMEKLLLSSLVKESISSLSDFAAEKRVRFKLVCKCDSEVNCDPQYLSLAINTLLHNAIRFSPSPGEVLLEITGKRGSIKLVITDHGPGIPESYLPHLFDAFVTQDLSHHTQGHGLNLAICREIINCHGGYIEVDSILNHMTRFYITLPALLTINPNAKDKTPVPC